MFLIRHVSIAGAYRKYNRISMNQITCLSSQQRSDFIAARQYNETKTHFTNTAHYSSRSQHFQVLNKHAKVYQSLSETPRSLITRHP